MTTAVEKWLAKPIGECPACHLPIFPVSPRRVDGDRLYHWDCERPRKGRLVITLTEAEDERAMDVGRRQREWAVENNLEDQYGLDPEDHEGNLVKHQIGAKAELVFAIYLGVEWEPVIGGLNSRQGDVEGKQVRGTKYPKGHLALHEPHKDDPDHPFVLVVAHDPPYTWRLAGWCWGREGQLDKYWRTNQRHPCFMVPQSDLRPIPDRSV